MTRPILEVITSDLNIEINKTMAKIKTKVPKNVEFTKPGDNVVEIESEISPKIGIK